MQTVYDMYMKEANIGMIADTSLRNIESRLAQGAIGIGKAVVRGTDPERQIVQAGTGAGQGALIVGISVFANVMEQGANGVSQYADKEQVPMMQKGRIWVETFDAVVAGATANFHLATGKFTDASVATGIEAMPLMNARFYKGNTAAGLAIIEFDAMAT